MLHIFTQKTKSMVRDLENGEGIIVSGMQWILRVILLSFLVISVPVFLYIMWLIPSL
ncbi:hypothetical protein NQ095_00305 [Rossellomorea sp. SC111]|uniref:hypothetical protein n=1 Tax=Rossellomorea sp. SC111 TaxID=2968985 RepID=UPI00215B4F99|nr:hypothetical protein [Rossellomorea sp. SC111]MCR8846830.1 hypothetical protein [Rossellomorea sp. SC111]